MIHYRDITGAEDWTDTQLLHEHLVYDDGAPNLKTNNVGFGPDGLFYEDTYELKKGIFMGLNTIVMC